MKTLKFSYHFQFLMANNLRQNASFVEKAQNFLKLYPIFLFFIPKIAYMKENWENLSDIFLASFKIFALSLTFTYLWMNIHNDCYPSNK